MGRELLIQLYSPTVHNDRLLTMPHPEGNYKNRPCQRSPTDGTGSNTYLVCMETVLCFFFFCTHNWKLQSARVYKGGENKVYLQTLLVKNTQAKEYNGPWETVFACKCYESFIVCVLSPLLKMWGSHKGFRDTTCCTDVFGSCLILHGSECPLKVILFFNPCTQTTTSDDWPLMKTSSIIPLTHCQSAQR